MTQSMVFLIRKNFFYIQFLFLLVFLVNCKSEHENFIENIQMLIHMEKYDKALELLQEKLESKRESDEVISRRAPRRERIVRLSEDRNRIVWVEDQNLIFRDITNPMVKTKTLPSYPQDIQISANGEYVVSSFQLKNTKGCRMIAYSLLDDSLEYESNAHISCRNKASITNNGDYIYYFIDENLYKERTKSPKKPTLIVPSDKISPPYPKLKNKFSLIPIEDKFLITSGIAGSYNLYFYDPNSNSSELISKDIVSPKITYNQGKSLFIIGGNVGSWYLREVIYKNEKKPKITSGFPITLREINSWKINTPNSFLSFHNGTVFIWSPMSARKELPLICEKGWATGIEKFVYENKDSELVLSNIEFTENEWKIFEIYKKVQKLAR